MKSAPSCPRCGRAVHSPSLWSSAWQCGAHGPVAPLRPVRSPSETSLELLIRTAGVPIWLPWPLPTGWVVTGFADAGDERSGALAVAVALSGPAPRGGIGEMVLVAEDPGVGLGARLAGLSGADPGMGFDTGAADHKVRHERHDIALWSVHAQNERVAYAGEAFASWLWLVLSPTNTGALVHELSVLRDLRDRQNGGVALELPFGAPSPFLASALKPAAE